MSYPDDVSALARALAHLVIDHSAAELNPDGLEAAMSARQETVRLLSQILRGTGTGDNWARYRYPGGGARGANERLQTVVSRTEAEPMRAFALLVGELPIPDLRHSASDFASRRPASPTEAAWHEVRRYAIAASHEWSALAGGLDGPSEWSAVADAAAITRTLTYLDHDLRIASQQEEVPGNIRDALERAEQTGLRLAADEVLHLARSGPLPDRDSQVPRTVPSRAVRVNSPAALIEAQRRLPQQLLYPGQTPARVARVALGQARILDTCAQILHRLDPDRAGRARALAEPLTHISPDAGQLATLAATGRESASAALAQTQQMTQHLRALRELGNDHPQMRAHRDAAIAVVDGAPAVITSLDELTQRNIYRAEWMVSYGQQKNEHVMWRPIGGVGDETPQLLVQLRAASALIDPAARRQRAQPEQWHRATPPREVLANIGRPETARPWRPAEISLRIRTLGQQLHAQAEAQDVEPNPPATEVPGPHI